MEHKNMAMEQGELSQPPQEQDPSNNTEVGSLSCADHTAGDRNHYSKHYRLISWKTATLFTRLRNRANFRSIPRSCLWEP